MCALRLTVQVFFLTYLQYWYCYDNTSHSDFLPPLSTIALRLNIYNACTLQEHMCVYSQHAPTCMHAAIHHQHHFWHASLVVHSTECRHQSPEWTILNHINCFIQGEVIGFQVSLLTGSLPDEASPTARLSLRRSSSISCQQTDLSLLTVWVFPDSLWRCWLIQTSLFYYQDYSNYW